MVLRWLATELKRVEPAWSTSPYLKESLKDPLEYLAAHYIVKEKLKGKGKKLLYQQCFVIFCT
jgi:hypothetical protein